MLRLHCGPLFRRVGHCVRDVCAGHIFWRQGGLLRHMHLGHLLGGCCALVCRLFCR